MNAIKNYWHQLSVRDQRVLGAGGLFIGIILLYSFLWAPVQDQLKRQRPLLLKQKSDLVWLQAQADTVRKLKQNRVANVSQKDVPLLTSIDQIAREMKLRDRIKQIQPGKEKGTAKIWFDKVVFEDWLRWLDNIAAKGIDVTRVSITKSAESPKVNIRLQLSR